MAKSISPEVMRPDALVEEDYATRCMMLAQKTIGFADSSSDGLQWHPTAEEITELTTTVD